MSTLSSSFTAVGSSGVLLVKSGEGFSWSLSGTWVGTILLQKSVGGQAWVTLATKTGNLSATSYYNETPLSQQYRVTCSAFTSGTIVFTFLDLAGETVWTQLNPKDGQPLFSVDDRGYLQVAGVSVSGTDLASLATGTVATSQVPYISATSPFTLASAANLAYDGTTVAIGGVAISATAALRVRKVFTDTTGAQISVSSNTSVVSASAAISIGHIDAGSSFGTIATAVVNTGTYYGVRAYGIRDAAGDLGTLSVLRGFWCYYGHNSTVGATAVTTACVGMYLQPDHGSAGSTITAIYGVYIDDPLHSGATVTTRYGVYQKNASDLNYFGGATTFGTSILFGNYHLEPSEYVTADSSTALTVNFANGSAQKVNMTGNCTFTFSNPVTGGVYILRLLQDATGSRTATWPGTVKWPGGAAPTLTTTAAKNDIISFYWDGTSYHGSSSLNY